MEEGTEVVGRNNVLGNGYLVGRDKRTSLHYIQENAVGNIDIIIGHSENMFQAPFYHGGSGVIIAGDMLHIIYDAE